MTAGAAAEDNGAWEIPFRIRRWTTEDRLPQQKISCLKQTHDGYLWIGTYFGLARYDGVRFTIFNESNTPELPSDAINALAEDSEGTLWIGTAEGLLKYSDQRFERIAMHTRQTNERVWRIEIARGGGFWLRTDFGVMQYKNGEFTTVLESGPEFVTSLREGANGELNIFTRNQWLTVKPETNTARSNECRELLTSPFFTGLPGRDEGTAWMGTKAGLYFWDHDTLRVVAESVLATNTIDFVFQDRDGNLWLNVRGVAFGRWDGKHWQPINFGKEFDKGSVTCMEEDAEGTIWIGTSDGLVQLHRTRAVVYTKDNNLADNKTWSICEGLDATIWVGTEHGLSAIHTNGQIESWRGEPTGDFSDRCVWPNFRGGVWTARNVAGLYEVLNGHFTQAASSKVVGRTITALWKGESGTLFVCSEDGVTGFNETDPLPWEKPTVTLPVREARGMLQARDGTLWLGTDGEGLVGYRNGVPRSLKQRDGIGSDHIYSMLEDSEGILWLGTSQGLTRYKNGELFPFTRRNGLLEETVNCVLADDLGHLWLSGQQGIYSISRAALNAVADQRSGTVQPFALGIADGLENTESNGEKQPAGCKARDGRLWFPTMRGVVAVDPKLFSTNETPPTVLIEQVKADGETLTNVFPNTRQGPINYHIAAGHGHVLEVQFTASSFLDPKRVRFRCRLTPVDADWREETIERLVSYDNLRPGRYRFEVKASNHHNVWNPVPTSIALVVAPYFWQTKAFYAVSGAAILALAAGIQAYRLRWQHRLLKLEQQRALAAERARIARDLHDDLGTALTGLALELDVIGRDPKPEMPVVHRLGQTAQRTRALAERMREVVWSVNPRCDTVSSLASFLEQQIGQFLRADGIKVELDFPEDIPPLPIGGEARHQLALGVREALTNVVRHAKATEVVLSLTIKENWLIVQVKDNGRGVQATARNGDGLRNMRERLESIGGAFDFSSEPGSGTTIVFRVPLIKEKSGESL